MASGSKENEWSAHKTIAMALTNFKLMLAICFDENHFHLYGHYKVDN
jgi:hypothetical protein